VALSLLARIFLPCELPFLGTRADVPENGHFQVDLLHSSSARKFREVSQVLLMAATAAKEVQAAVGAVAKKVRGKPGKWGKKKQFPTKHGILLKDPVAVKQAYLANQIYLYGVDELALQWPSKGPGNTGLRYQPSHTKTLQV
jgi:hypothetical protein